MRSRHLLASLICVATLAAVAAPEAADARRRVIDAGQSLSLSGYCSPVEASGVGCPATALPFQIQIGAQTYSSFYVNSNGTLSLGSIEAHLAPQNSFTGDPFFDLTYTGPAPATSLSVLGAPVFSPAFVDGPGFFNGFSAPEGYDGVFVATTSLTANSLSVDWFACATTVSCGPLTVEMVANYTFNPDDSGLSQIIADFGTTGETLEERFNSGKPNYLAFLAATQKIYSLVLTDLQEGFIVDYTYSPGALGEVRTSGFALPGNVNERTGPLANQRFAFNGFGQLIAAPVPEPGTWASMLLGFLILGFTLRRGRRNRQWAI